MGLVTCPDCGTQISDQANSCINCGRPINQTMASAAVATFNKSRSVAVLLALFLGGLGVHKFYVEKPGVGVVYLLFCWTFLPAIIGLIEAIQYLSMSNETFEEKYFAKQL